jgi:hypothetical protein
MAQTLLAEVYPAEVTLPDGSFVPRARVFVLAEGVLVYGQEDGQAVLKYRGRHSAEPTLPNTLHPRRRQFAEISTPDGTVRANRVLGCTCKTPHLSRIDIRQIMDVGLLAS